MPTNNKVKPQRFIEKCYKDDTGAVTLAQTPNLPITVWFVCAVLRLLPLPLKIDSGIGFIGTSFLFYWAWLELSSGANYFRRILGCGVLLSIIAPHFR